MTLRPMEWTDHGFRMLDQRRLPHQEVWLELHSWFEVAEAIRNMTVRGAPAIGIAAAFGMALAVRHGEDREVADRGLRASRPTAVNLFIALDRIKNVPDSEVLQEAQAIEAEDLAINEAIGQHGLRFLNEIRPGPKRILTICNTGAVATAGLGTALGIIRVLHRHNLVAEVLSCETRPRQQGLRLTAWELLRESIPFRSIVDSAAAFAMASKQVDVVIVGADRIARNGDTANKIGTLSLAVLAHHYRIPFVVAAPSTTFDSALADGRGIPIEERDAEEITEIEGERVAPAGTPVWNPGFDVTPGDLISAIISEQSIYQAPFAFGVGQ
ncbi:MAG: S-methyl-5-thioribose-1-phosphate isomerase [Fimbriimonadaceae bacterium]|nr:S-methyl-5-thioribose-1-phosphate isomerase [Fimbriimonadaceae bacterium]